MLKAAFFILAKACKQLRYSSIGKWVNKPWYFDTMEYYLSLKRSNRNNNNSHDNIS